MSNVPTLLRQCAEGLRKEASEARTSMEVTGHCAINLLTKAAEVGTPILAAEAYKAAYQFSLMKVAYDTESDSDGHKRRIDDLEEEVESLRDQLTEVHGKYREFAKAMFNPSKEDMEEYRDQLARLHGINAKVRAARYLADSKYNAESGFFNRNAGLVGTAGGALAGAALGHKAGGTVAGSILGAGVGGILGLATRKPLYDHTAPEFLQHPDAHAAEKATYEKTKADISDDDVKDALLDIKLGEDAHPRNAVKNMANNLTFYKQAGFAALQELQAQGAIGSDVAAAALLELNRRLSQ